ncbi:hypothetical protein [Phaeodactylibacter luteus]|uniref:Uncharacterized protein n=1 Tax=Phaeodactylibacter luteus TaxID=1564516 RepID=A0A5C6RKG4_9BACT|nr:hypothetical protein [Phaeodactylibacter luteus]TXB62723.1 hypothetical protein FRY97_12810 [Phaeodactylibacter luteus]
MKKRPYFLLLCMLSCLMTAWGSPSVHGAGQGQSGMSVWSSALYIHAADTLLMRGDLYLFQAEVSGQGAILLSDTVPCRIVSEGGSLPRLIVQQTDTVALFGELHIRKGLTLALGVLDARAGVLTLSDSAWAEVLPGSEWLQADAAAAHWLPVLPLLPPTGSRVFSTIAISPYPRPAVLPARRSGSALFFVIAWPCEAGRAVPTPPPKHINCCPPATV